MLNSIVSGLFIFRTIFGNFSLWLTKLLGKSKNNLFLVLPRLKRIFYHKALYLKTPTQLFLLENVHIQSAYTKKNKFWKEFRIRKWKNRAHGEGYGYVTALSFISSTEIKSIVSSAGFIYITLGIYYIFIFYVNKLLVCVQLYTLHDAKLL